MRTAAVALPLLLAGCFKASPPPAPHYALGQGYQAGGHWYYPQESYTLDETGIATVEPAGKSGLTADGEAYDAALAAAGHQTLQLPAVALVTNLENGRQIRLRVNDRGPANPARMLALTPKAASLLGVGERARVRLTVLAEESHAAVDAVGGGPKLAIATAPREAIRATELLPPGETGAGPTRVIGGGGGDAAAVSSTITRLPETVQSVPANLGVLMLRLGSFTNQSAAAGLAARAASFGARLVPQAGRRAGYDVEAGPYATIDEADAALSRALADGLPDARIIIH
jgi:rare lipoprotein A